jgi:activator of 2-hydroxyglutaryl-CoA dehydratase
MGRNIEIMADLLQVPIQEMGERSLTVSKDPEPVSTTCYNFANTEAIGLFREGYKENEVLAAYLFAITWRIHGMVGRVQPEKEVAFTGGLAKNPNNNAWKGDGMTSLRPVRPAIGGAIGALIAGAVVGADKRSLLAPPY